jgi:Zn finger protein HypA/HybF involved in hydrogenase expression
MDDNGGKNMAKCLKCGAEVGSPKKRWKMTGRPDKTGKRTQLEIGLFECPKCHSKFRVALSKRKI